jgi:hypothetical protein
VGENTVGHLHTQEERLPDQILFWPITPENVLFFFQRLADSVTSVFFGPRTTFNGGSLTLLTSVLKNNYHDLFQ